MKVGQKMLGRRCKICGKRVWIDQKHRELVCENGHILEIEETERIPEAPIVGYIQCTKLVGNKRKRFCRYIVPIRKYDDPSTPNTCPKCGSKYYYDRDNKSVLTEDEAREKLFELQFEKYDSDDISINLEVEL